MGIETPSRHSAANDYRNILSGTSQNVLGIAIAALATFAVQILMTNTLGAEAFGMVTVATQAAFVLSFATRAGMDMAVLRDVAVEAGVGRHAFIRAKVARSVAIAVGVSTLFALAGVLGAGGVRDLFSIDDATGRYVVEVAALGLPFLALSNVWLSATRGLKIMRYTLYVFWAGQPLMWLVLMLAGWRVSETSWMSAAAYSASWALATVAAYLFWKRESRGWDAEPLEPGALKALINYAGPRAPAALFSQLLFWTDLFVLTRYASDTEVGIYSAALRAGQILVLFLTSVSLMFSPFVADLHNRGETERLDKLFKALTRWTLAATIPLFLLLAVVPGPALRIFGSEFAGGGTALLILLAGQFINVATGSVGFVLIMVGRTGWDLVVYAVSLAINLVLAFWLCPRYGMEGAAIANAVTFTLSKWARLALVHRFVHIQPYNGDYLRLLPPALASAAAMWLTHKFIGGVWATDLLATAAIGAVVYGGTYLLFGLTEAERRVVRNLAAARSNKTP
ncbi:MAG TPA: polysaccharide biosynthesis C-terminal domain-containing protein [Actinomycetota bacterium]|nr:polysaccharide biosynthesis C-terminal domain-containing protein [Actinomycetota bacterium]